MWWKWDRSGIYYRTEGSSCGEGGDDRAQGFSESLGRCGGHGWRKDKITSTLQSTNIEQDRLEKVKKVMDALELFESD